ncbi:MAG: hypothetical protein IKH10_00790 [Bacteroidetes bacterium]|nr:hypothetical protein [Bacteroidota bacterium]
MVRIYYGKLLNVPLEDRERFEKFIKLCTIARFKDILFEKEEYLEPLLNALNLNIEIILNHLNELIETRSLTYSFLLGFNNSIKAKGESIATKLNMIDYGNQITGLPKLIFNEIFNYIKDHIAEYYIKYLGLVK